MKKRIAALRKVLLCLIITTVCSTFSYGQPSYSMPKSVTKNPSLGKWNPVQAYNSGPLSLVGVPAEQLLLNLRNV